MTVLWADQIRACVGASCRAAQPQAHIVAVVEAVPAAFPLTADHSMASAGFLIIVQQRGRAAAPDPRDQHVQSRSPTSTKNLVTHSTFVALNASHRQHGLCLTQLDSTLPSNSSNLLTDEHAAPLNASSLS